MDEQTGDQQSLYRYQPVWNRYFQSGASNDLERVVDRYQWLVDNCAASLIRRHGDMDRYVELKNRGMIGLRNAVTRYDPSTNVRFLTIAATEIYTSMREF